MNKKELDEKVLAAITTLNSEGKSLTVINIENITGLLKYQIYSSKYKSQLEIRGRKAKATFRKLEQFSVQQRHFLSIRIQTKP